MKNAACIALLALAVAACSKSDNTQTPSDVDTTSPGTTTTMTSPAGNDMPASETPASNETMAPSADGGMPAATGNGAAGNGANGTGATGNGSTGSAATANGNLGSGATATSPAGGPSRPDADNTRVNERDRGTSVTPMDQGNNDSDLKITQKIRQAVMGDGSLSFTAKNVKIITNKGTVVLRGPVKSDDERARIDSAAKSVAGASNVINEIEIKK